MTFADPNVDARVREWTSEHYDATTRSEIEALIKEGRRDEIEDRFHKNLAFGTGGLRGKLGAGTNRMNAYVVARATQGLANYVKAHATMPGPLRAAIAHDSRHRSREFTEVAAGVFAANGIYVHVSPTLRPTPYLSFAVRQLGCHTGIMVTASHNPKEYNGYKVYWDDGSQVVPPHDEAIIDEVNKITSDDMVQRIKFEEGIAKGLIKVMGDEMDTAFLDAVIKQRFDEKIIHDHAPRIVYTPLHGAGGTMVPRALAMWGFRDVIPEPEQMKPDGDFPTAASPNPEEGPALDRAVALARAQNADLVLATDPDADRLGIAVRDRGQFHLVTGNQVSSLLCEFILRNRKARGPADAKYGVVTTVVTSPMVQKVAHAHGAQCPLVLTGFKWIAQQMRDWESAGTPEFLYGTEESYGYLIGRHCRDKDGIVAACAVAEMTAQASANGRTLLDELDQLFLRHGVHYEWTKSVTMPGISGAQRIQALLDGLRRKAPDQIAGRKVVRYTRLDNGEVFEHGRKTAKVDLPPSDAFIFDLNDGSRVIVRPSGTEPKIKFYFFLCDNTPRKEPADARACYAQLALNVPQFESQFLASVGLSN